MFKRQFYAIEHSNRGDSASSSSSSSLATASDGEGGPDVEDDGAWPASSHESDASSEEEVVEAEGATSAQWTLDEPKDVADGSDNDADRDTSDVEPRERKRKKDLSNQWAEAVDDDESEGVLQKFEASSVICVGESNKVLKCRVCPKIVCLSEESMESHLASKGHARSLKQLAEGRLKVQLDSDGDEEEEGETHAERFARTISTAQEEKKTVKRKRDSGRQRQSKRMKRKALEAAKEGKSATEVPLISQPTATQLEGKVLGTQKGKRTPSQLASTPSVAKSVSKGNGSLGKHLPPTSQKKNASFKSRTDRPSKAKHRK